MSAKEYIAAEIHVSGRVQGVGYRYFTERVAAELGVRGWSMNLPDGRVKLDVEAAKPDLESFVDELRRGPSMSNVTDVSVSYRPYDGRYNSFSIRF